MCEMQLDSRCRLASHITIAYTHLYIKVLVYSALVFTQKMFSFFLVKKVKKLAQYQKRNYLCVIKKDKQSQLNNHTMTRTTLTTQLAKFKGAKNSIAYKIALDLINGTKSSYHVLGSQIRPVSTSGSGRYTTNLDYTTDCIAILNFLGLKFEIGNDAPRGGAKGTYINVLTKIS